jgi:hypothetical protein
LSVQTGISPTDLAGCDAEWLVTITEVLRVKAEAMTRR